MDIFWWYSGKEGLEFDGFINGKQVWFIEGITFMLIKVLRFRLQWGLTKNQRDRGGCGEDRGKGLSTGDRTQKSTIFLPLIVLISSENDTQFEAFFFAPRPPWSRSDDGLGDK